ncbi:tRNA (guanine-N(7)-)-methyltransferase non-catalytic subunit wdr4 isoform X1 [Hypanus sabinus]|uniref:tRNA (guanine-N(7)-)-methyltransferase non-catalytic subunit wdr4 isoform X1 n=1 Tax=Hypanus sabinus TaxID=79690 RepID=UPI0028C4985C|nr:tRNA (guanine-N(7)-)-methyltransferase non-catalytic subunit wdr4 isoform X1 [Hypanus sabinus]
MLFGCCGATVFFSRGARVLGLSLGHCGEPFVYDCTAETREADAGDSDEIVAFAFSPSGTYLAVSADNKQLILFRTRPWQCLSVRYAVRRSTSLAITAGEDQILLADKSGDVYSFSIQDPQRPGQLQLGHLSMLLAVVVSPEDRFVITADRDEKIRVSLLEQPYTIEAFCLGHHEFVSELCIPPNHPQLLLSGSGDGTIRLWEYQSGMELDCFKMSEIQASGCQKARCAVVRIVHCKQGDNFAVLCDDFSSVHIFKLDVVAQKLNHLHTITVRQRAWDIAFDDISGLWILDGEMVVVYQPQDGHWQHIPEHPDQQKMEEAIHANWEELQGSATANSYSSLYKVTVDNIAQYQSKKKLRVHQRQKKRTMEIGQMDGHSKRAKGCEG